MMQEELRMFRFPPSVVFNITVADHDVTPTAYFNKPLHPASGGNKSK